MSLRIYDAYVLNENYSMHKLSLIMDELRKEIEKICSQNIFDMAIEKSLYYHYFGQLHGEAVLLEMIENTKDDKRQQSIWEAVCDKDWTQLFIMVLLKIKDRIVDVQIKNKYDPDYDFKCQLQLFPMDNKILAMYFGNKDIRDLIAGSEYFIDYHYQNETDRPEEVSDEEWRQREKDWREVIGPNYVPTSHGFSVNLYNSTCLIPGLKNAYHVPDQGEMLAKLRNTMASISTVKGFPEADKPYSVWVDFFLSLKDKAWVANVDKEILSKCEFLKTPEEIEKFFDLGD